MPHNPMGLHGCYRDSFTSLFCEEEMLNLTFTSHLWCKLFNDADSSLLSNVRVTNELEKICMQGVGASSRYQDLLKGFRKTTRNLRFERKSFRT
jgi:hypothetical protein